MKLLYLSCHSILEFDEIQLFSELGIDVFSFGTYKNPGSIDDPKRPTLNLPVHEDLLKLAHMSEQEASRLGLKDPQMCLQQEMVDWADVVLVMHRSDWIHHNWELLRGKDVIWRSIGQSTTEVENDLAPLRARGINIVRYSPREQTIPGFVGQDAMIRFYKDPNEFQGWTGQMKAVLSVAQDMISRSDFCNYPFFETATHSFPRFLLGKGSEAVYPWGKGIVSYDELKDYLRKCRVYFYTGTYPACYTLSFIEALMTGIPMVALGERLGNSPYYLGQQTYEIPDFSEANENILMADDSETAVKYIQQLFDDPKFANELSFRGRQTAIKYFGKETAKKEWKKYLKGGLDET